MDGNISFCKRSLISNLPTKFLTTHLDKPGIWWLAPDGEGSWGNRFLVHPVDPYYFSFAEDIAPGFVSHTDLKWGSMGEFSFHCSKEYFTRFRVVLGVDPHIPFYNLEKTTAAIVNSHIKRRQRQFMERKIMDTEVLKQLYIRQKRDALLVASHSIRERTRQCFITASQMKWDNEQNDSVDLPVYSLSHCQCTFIEWWDFFGPILLGWCMLFFLILLPFQLDFPTKMNWYGTCIPLWCASFIICRWAMRLTCSRYDSISLYCKALTTHYAEKDDYPTALLPTIQFQPRPKIVRNRQILLTTIIVIWSSLVFSSLWLLIRLPWFLQNISNLDVNMEMDILLVPITLSLGLIELFSIMMFIMLILYKYCWRNHDLGAFRLFDQLWHVNNGWFFFYGYMIPGMILIQKSYIFDYQLKQNEPYSWYHIFIPLWFVLAIGLGVAVWWFIWAWFYDMRRINNQPRNDRGRRWATIALFFITLPAIIGIVLVIHKMEAIRLNEFTDDDGIPYWTIRFIFIWIPAIISLCWATIATHLIRNHSPINHPCSCCVEC